MNERFDRVVKGGITKTLGIGLAAALICAALMSLDFALGVVSGTIFGALNLWVLVKVTGLIIQRGRAKVDSQQKETGFLSLVVAGQFVFVFAAAALFVYMIGFKPIAFTIGFSSFLIGLAWQGLIEHRTYH